MTTSVRDIVPSVVELRAIARGLRRRVRQPAWASASGLRAGPPDDRLLATMVEPFDSVGDVLERLGETETYLRERSDRRSVFLTIYAEMTANVVRGIDAGTFESPAWVREYLVAFAERYRTALVDAERGDVKAVPPAWRLAFRAAASGETLFLQDALLGVNAHINHDLSYALCDVGIDANRRSKRRDHDRINDVLRELVDVVQHALAEVYDAGGYASADEWLSTVDEDLTIVGLSEARSLAWRNAVVVSDVRWPVVRRSVDWRIRAVSMGTGYLLLASSADPNVLRALRRLEREQLPLESLETAFHRRVDERRIDLR